MLKVLNKISSTHELHCEDSFFVHENENIIFGGVFDGCSTGEKSHWASENLVLLFDKHKNIIINSSSNDIEHSSDYFILEIISNLKTVQEIFKVDQMHFLSTAIFFYYNKIEKAFYCKFFGDGSIFVKQNNKWLEYNNDENNMPKYLGYFINENYALIHDYIKTRKAIKYENITDFTITSDGIDSFVNIFPNKEDIIIESAKNYLLYDTQFNKLNSELGKKFNLLTKDHWIIKDDLTIIKYINNEA